MPFITSESRAWRTGVDLVQTLGGLPSNPNDSNPEVTLDMFARTVDRDNSGTASVGEVKAMFAAGRDDYNNKDGFGLGYDGLATDDDRRQVNVAGLFNKLDKNQDGKLSEADFSSDDYWGRGDQSYGQFGQTTWLEQRDFDDVVSRVNQAFDEQGFTVTPTPPSSPPVPPPSPPPVQPPAPPPSPNEPINFDQIRQALMGDRNLLNRFVTWFFDMIREG